MTDDIIVKITPFNTDHQCYATIKHEIIDEAHTLSSEHIKGFLIMHNDKQVAMEQITPRIKILLEKNHGLPCDVEVMKSLIYIIGEN